MLKFLHCTIVVLAGPGGRLLVTCTGSRLGHWRADRKRSEPRAHSSSSQAAVASAPAGRPPEPSVNLAIMMIRPSDSAILPVSGCPAPGRRSSVRSCCPIWKPAFRSGPVKNLKKHQGLAGCYRDRPFGTRTTVNLNTDTLHTRFVKSPYTHCYK